MTRRTHWTAQALCIASAAVLSMTFVSTVSWGAPQIVGDQKAKIKGIIVSRAGDLVKVNDKKIGSPVIVVINDGTSADQAGAQANQAGQAAHDAGAVAVIDAAAISMVNKRVSDLDEYKTVAEAGIYFAGGKADLDAAAKADLDTLAAAVNGVDGYMIEIAGYASSTGTKQLDQKLSADRAAVVAHYLMEQDNVPMRRILAPAGYGATHPAATNSDPQGRALNQRVDVKVIVNKGWNEAT